MTSQISSQHYCLSFDSEDKTEGGWKVHCDLVEIVVADKNVIS